MIDPQNAKSIFSAAAELPAGERAAYLDDATAGDAALRGRVEALLAAHDHPDSFLDAAAVSFAATVDLSPVEPPLAERPGDAIGPYKLLEQIGEGGMGVVYMAEQQAPVRRRVALKVIKTGMDTRQVIARFEAERQALALMDHANIARVLDAGATESGRPYFVMELVRGVPITEYCDQHNLPVHERLELFVQVCHAVQHAHQKGIIHRDLKPTNVLVTVNDGRATPKVIDFGVAKATGQQLTEKTLFTAFAQMVGTPLYMSPEQAEMTSVDIDTRSDIYSLGVLIYELLTGTTPFDQERLRAAAFDEIRRIIREEEPPKPSTRISTLGEARTATAAHRQVDAHRLSQLVEGDLDWIVMKCLDKDRTRRYETAVGLAEDVGRYLSDEPVHAGRPTRAYRLRKFIRRNQVGALAGAIVVAALAGGLTLASIGMVQSRRQAQIAFAQTTKATAINELLQQMLRSANPTHPEGPEYSVRQMLDDFSAGLSEHLDGQPEVDASIRATIGDTYLNLNKLDQAEPHLRAALDIRRRFFGENHPDVAASYVAYASFLLHYHMESKSAEIESLVKKALAIFEKLNVVNRATIDGHVVLGQVMLERMQYHDADAAWNKARELVERQPTADRQLQLATILQCQAIVSQKLGRTSQAEVLARDAMALILRAHGNNHPQTAASLATLGSILGDQRKFAEAEQCYRVALAIYRHQYGDKDAWFKRFLAQLLLVLRVQGDKSPLDALEAEPPANDMAALADCDKALAQSPNSWFLLGRRGMIYARQGDYDRADADFARAVELAPDVSLPAYARALVCLARNDRAEFDRASKSLADGALQRPGAVAMQLATQLFVMAPDSAMDSSQALELAELTLESSPPPKDYALSLLGATLYRVGRLEDAAKKLQEGLDAYGSRPGNTESDHYYPSGYLFLAMTHHRLGHSKEAADWLNRASAIIDARQGGAASWPNSMILGRLRLEAEALLGVTRGASTRAQ